MDAEEVVKSIQKFFGDLLPKANCSSNWDEISISNAFHWSQFCEQIYQSYKEDSCRIEIDDLIHSFPLTVKENRSLCFEDLENCTLALHEAFLENPYIENKLVEAALSKTTIDKTNFENLQNEGELNSLCFELMENLKNVEILDSDRSFYHEVKAEVYLNMLKDTVQHMTSEEQVEEHISCLLEKLRNNEGMILLLHVLMHKVPETCSSLSEVQEYVINWTMFKMLSEENCSLSKFMWKQPSKLHRICLNSSDFHNFYLDFLTKCSLSLRCEYGVEEAVWIINPSENVSLSFEEILSHFRTLLGSDGDVCERTKNHLLNLLNTQPNVAIWKEIFSRIS